MVVCEKLDGGNKLMGDCSTFAMSLPLMKLLFRCYPMCGPGLHKIWLWICYYNDTDIFGMSIYVCNVFINVRAFHFVKGVQAILTAPCKAAAILTISRILPAGNNYNTPEN